MRNRRLIVAGCSVSDYSGTEVTYGEVIARLSSMDYIDESAECGSNFRIWRRITSMIRKGDINENDVLIIQYTTPERKEFYSHHEFESNRDKPNGKMKPLREPYDDGSTVKFKYYSYDFYRNDDEKSFMRLLQEGFTSITYDEEVFINFQYMFQFMLKELRIKTVFLRELKYQPKFIDTIECDTQLYYPIDGYFREGLATLYGNVYGHLNDQGHTKLGNDLFEILKLNKFV